MSTGVPALHTCGKRTHCDRCAGLVSTGHICFQIPKMKSGFTTRPIFCVECTADIIEQTKTELLALAHLIHQGGVFEAGERGIKV